MKLTLLAQMSLKTARHMWAYKRNTLEPFKGCQGHPGCVQRAFQGFLRHIIHQLNTVCERGTFPSFYPQKYHYDDKLRFQNGPNDCFACVSHCLEKSKITKKMGPFQFYIPDVQNYPSYPKQKEFLKSNEGNLK